MSDVGDRADLLADMLAECGHDDITGLDLLDALASTGLTLAPATDDVASLEYYGHNTPRN